MQQDDLDRAERATRGMALIGGGVSLATALAPRPFLRLFGVRPDEVTGIAVVGWRLFAARTAAISLLAWRGDPTARALFGPLQAADQVVFWEAFRTRALPRPGAALAASVSGVIVALDLVRRRAGG